MPMHTLSTWLMAATLAIAAAAPIGAPAADDAQALLAKHQAFVGWKYGDGTVMSLHLDRTVTDASGKITDRASENRIGLAYRRDYLNAAGDAVLDSSGFTGRLFWTTSDNGFTVPIVNDNAKYYLAIDVLFMEGSVELPATVVGTSTIGGTPVSIVRVTMDGALPVDLYEDPQTGAFVQAVIDPKGSLETTIVIHSYADLAPGKKIIGSWSFGTEKDVYAYTKIQLNPSIAASDLHPPEPSATWTFANSRPFPIKVTDTRIYVDAKVNGVPGRFILDTGADGIALTDDFANRAHVKTTGHARAFGIGGTTKTLVREADTIEIGGNTLSHVVITTLNESMDDRDERPDGLMGFDLFGGSIVYLTLSDGTMRLLDPSTGPASPPQDAVSIPVDLTSFVPQTPAKIADKLTISATLDTGGSDLVLLSDKIEDHGVHIIANRSGFLGGNATIAGIAGDERTVCGPLARLQVGPFAYTGIAACESHNWDLSEGLIGFDFLKHFDYVFDYPHGALYMIPHG